MATILRYVKIKLNAVILMEEKLRVVVRKIILTGKFPLVGFPIRENVHFDKVLCALKGEDNANGACELVI